MVAETRAALRTTNRSYYSLHVMALPLEDFWMEPSNRHSAASLSPENKIGSARRTLLAYRPEERKIGAQLVMNN